MSSLPLDIEPWELFPLPPEQRTAIQSYIERRVAQAVERATLPERGDPVAEWVKRYRDLYINPSTGERTGVWHAIDDMLDDYREHADTGVPLSGHVVGPHEET